MLIKCRSFYLTLLTACVFSVTVGACLRSQKDHEARASKAKISVNGTWMVDGYGRVRIFHGFNAVQKGFPWYPSTMSDKKLDFYQQWGFNAVRLGAMWAGVEPTEGATNVTYLNIVKDMVKRAGNHGIYVLLDMHQDVISTAFHAYDGVPRWVIDKMPASKHAYPWPLTKLSQSADGYLTEAVGNAFQCLYDNVSGARDSMAHFWQTVASNFKTFDNVIGYELINEPWAGNIYDSPDLLLPGNAGRRNLAPLYEVLNTAIRKVDNSTIIFYEPVTWGIVLPGDGTLGNGFKSVPGGPAYTNRSVMSWHYYCWILKIDDTGAYNGIQRAVCDQLLGPKVFKTVNEDIHRTGGSSFLTEFGLCEPNNHFNETETIECDFILDQADKNFASWTYWDSPFFNTTTGEVRYNLVKHFARVYASATAGIPTSMSYNVQTKKFMFTFTPNPSISAPTEIVIPPLSYPNGFNVVLSPGYDWKFDKTANTMYITPKANAISASEVNLWISQK